MGTMLRLALTALLAMLGAASLAVAAPVTDDDLHGLWRRGDLAGMERIAAAGDARAQAWMGLMLHNRGRYEEAIGWYARAVAQGDGRSAARIANFHERGIGRPRDMSEAVGWYRKGAALGHAESQARYASALRRGDVLPRDEAAAYRWYRAAARQQHAHAYLPLAEMSAQGSGAPRDWQRAYALAKVAEHAVDDSDFENQERARALQAEAAARLQPHELRAAARRFAALRPDLAERLARREARWAAIVSTIAILAVAGIGFGLWRDSGRAARQPPA